MEPEVYTYECYAALATRQSARGLSTLACAMSATEFPTARFLPGVLLRPKVWLSYRVWEYSLAEYGKFIL